MKIILRPNSLFYLMMQNNTAIFNWVILKRMHWVCALLYVGSSPLEDPECFDHAPDRPCT